MVCGDKDSTIAIKANSTVHLKILCVLKREGDLMRRLWTRHVIISDDSYQFSSMPKRRNRMKTTARLDEPRGRGR